MRHAIADIRIPQKRGRPKKTQFGHTTDSANVGEFARGGSKSGTPAYCTMPCRLLDLESAAAYLGVSPWTVRDLEAAGVLKRVRVPLPDGRDLRKLLFDKTDLDRLIELWKDSAA